MAAIFPTVWNRFSSFQQKFSSPSKKSR